MDDLLADFLTETTENLTELDVALVRLERTPDDAGTLSLIFPLVHTIKGTCGFHSGLPRLERVAHAAEKVLSKVRDGVLVVTPDVVSHVPTALDRIKLILAGLAATEAEPSGDDSELIAALDRAASGHGDGAAGITLPGTPPSAPSAICIGDGVRRASAACDHAAPAPEPIRAMAHGDRASGRATRGSARRTAASRAGSRRHASRKPDGRADRRPPRQCRPSRPSG